MAVRLKLDFDEIFWNLKFKYKFLNIVHFNIKILSVISTNIIFDLPLGPLSVVDDGDWSNKIKWLIAKLILLQLINGCSKSERKRMNVQY